MMIDRRSSSADLVHAVQDDLGTTAPISVVSTMLGTCRFLWLRWAYLWVALAMVVAVAATFGARTLHPWFVWIAVAALVAGLITVFVLPGGASDGPASPAFVGAAIRHARKPAARHLVDVLVPRVAIYPDQPVTRSEVLIALWDAERATSRGRLNRQKHRERLLLAQRETILACRSKLDLETSHKV